MAVYVITAQYVSINSVDLSAYVRSCTLELNADTPEFTTMGSSGAREYKQGLKAGTLNVEFNQDFANSASATDQAIWGMFNTGTNVAFEIRATSAGVGTTNPKYTGNVVPVNYPAVGGAVGDAATVSISWPTSGAVARATS